MLPNHLQLYPLIGCMSRHSQFTLLGLSLQELTEIAENLGEFPYRGRQLYSALYRQRCRSLEDVTTLAQTFRQALASQGFSLGALEIEQKFTSSDGTERYLLRLAGGHSVETVWMPEGDGGEAGDRSEADSETDDESAPDNPAGLSKNRKPAARRPAFRRSTICVSSQAGCAVDCQFCMTALLGLQSNLSAGEIVGQVLAVLNDHDVDVQSQRINLVFMGQGEPFLNYENFMKAVRLLADPEGVGIPMSRMTVSTSGIVPRIYDFGKEEFRPKLAISLNASNDELRTRLMPINKKWDLEKLITAAREFPLRPRERLTFEYVLLGSVNDSPRNAREVAELIRGLDSKVNLIALNPGPEIPFATPSQERVLEFQRILIAAGIPAYIRVPRGRDIFAACGQLQRTAAKQLEQPSHPAAKS
jgi:23S rRNA (adenine2503-C2)-methyltransferase